MKTTGERTYCVVCEHVTWHHGRRCLRCCPYEEPDCVHEKGELFSDDLRAECEQDAAGEVE